MEFGECWETEFGRGRVPRFEYCSVTAEPGLFTRTVTLKRYDKSEMKYVCKGLSIVSTRYPYMELLFGLVSL